MDKQMRSAARLLNDIEELLHTTEYGVVSLKGVHNLSRSDLETIKEYAKEYSRNFGSNFGPYMEPMGEIRDVLVAYGVTIDGGVY